MDNKSNLSTLIKATKDGYSVAFQQVLNESQLTLREINELWSEYSYLIDEKSGVPYNYIPVFLPRERIIINVSKKGTDKHGDKDKGKGKGKGKTETQFRDPECLTVEGCETEFHRSDFYGNERFQFELRNYYKGMNKFISMFQTRKGWLMKIYMD